MEDARKGSKKSLFFILLRYFSLMLSIPRVHYPTPQAIFISQYGSTEFPFLLRERSTHPEHIKMEHILVARDVITPGRSNFSLGEQKQNKTDCYLTIFLLPMGKEL